MKHQNLFKSRTRFVISNENPFRDISLKILTIEVAMPLKITKRIISVLSIFDKATERREKTQKHGWRNMTSYFELQLLLSFFAHDYNFPFDTRRRRRTSNVNEPLQWKRICLSANKLHTRCEFWEMRAVRFCYFPFLSPLICSNNDGYDASKKKTPRECLINLLFIVVRSSSSDTKLCSLAWVVRCVQFNL